MFTNSPYVNVSLVLLIVWSSFSSRFLRKGSWVQYSLNYCILMIVDLCPWYLKVNVSGYKILGSHFLLLRILIILLPYPLLYGVAVERFDGNLIFLTLHITFGFCLDDQTLSSSSGSLSLWGLILQGSPRRLGWAVPRGQRASALEGTPSTHLLFSWVKLLTILPAPPSLSFHPFQ